VLTTLVVPIRYRVAVRHGENLFYLKGSINWLLHIVHLSVSHIEGLLHIQARLFGFIIYDNLKPKKPKKAKEKIAKKKSVRKKTVKEKTVKEKTVKEKTIKEKTVKINAVTKKVASNETVKKNKERKNYTIRNSEQEVTSDPELSTKSSENVITQIVEDTTENWSSVEEKLSDISNESINKHRITIVQEVSQTAKSDNIKSSEDSSATTNGGRQERISFFKKVQERFRRFRDKLVSTFLKWKAKMGQIFSTVSSLRFKMDLILKFLRDELNKEGIHLTFSSLKKLLKHIMPTKLKSKLTFGTGDPCSTGQALGAMSILYSFYGDRINITPDFERNILEGEHFARGRIRLVTILIIVVKLIFDKRFKQLKNNFIILKEAL
jgi:hypothetical protein